jgi:glycosyltransferase involved in cell wall biosynthesis
VNINYHSFLPHLGYGVAARGYIELIRENPVNAINWKTYQFDNQTPEHLTTAFTAPADLNFIHLTPNYIPKVFDEHCSNLANTVFETTQLPAEWLPNLNRVDRVAVPCTWNKQVFEEAIKKPVYLLPHLCQFKGIPPASTDTLLQLPQDQFTFLTVGTWELRKNLEQLVDTFCRVFSKKDPVQLIIKTSENDLSRRRYSWQRVAYWQKTTKSLQGLMRYKRNAPSIRLLPTILPDQTMQQLYHQCHAYVTLTHGEGWGMGAYEAAWFGKPVIATGFGGYLDFLKEDNSFLVPYKLIPYKKNPWDSSDRSKHYYAQPDIKRAEEYMRHVYHAYGESVQKGHRLSEYVHLNLNRQKIKEHLGAFLST